MATSERFLDNIIHFLSPLNDVTIPPVYRKDGIIETNVGCFRLAYAKSGAAALFYARHPDDLAGIADTNGLLEVAHKDRVYLISMEKIHSDRGRRWHPRSAQEGMEHLDLTRLSHQIPFAVDQISRASLREAVLHRIDSATRVSAFVAYQTLPGDGDDDAKRIRILTKLDRNYCVPELAEQIGLSENGGVKGVKALFRACADQLSGRNIGGHFPLCVKVDGQDYQYFPTDDVSRAVNADFAVRLAHIASGFDPVRWRENLITPVLRFGAALISRLEEIKPTSDHFSWEETGRTIGILAMHAAEGLDGIKAMMIDALAEKFGLGKPLTCVPHDWQKLVKHHRHLLYIDSSLNNTLHQVNPEEFRDLKWVEFEHGAYTANFVNDASVLAVPDADRTFRNWLITEFRAPYGATFVYRDGKGDVINPIERLDDTQVIQVENANGITMHYDTHARKLYAYYHRPEFLTGDCKLPADADRYLTADTVIEIDFMSRDRAMNRLPFTEFRDRMRAIGKPQLELPPAQTPSGTDIHNAANLPAPSLPVSAHAAEYDNLWLM